MTRLVLAALGAVALAVAAYYVVAWFAFRWLGEPDTHQPC